MKKRIFALALAMSAIFSCNANATSGIVQVYDDIDRIGNVRDFYACYGFVKTIDGTEIIFDDGSNIWSAHASGFNRGDLIIAIMDSHGTESIFDDSLVAVQKVDIDGAAANLLYKKTNGKRGKKA